MAGSSNQSDMGVGLSVLFGLIALGAAVAMFVLGEHASAWGFAAAITAATIAVFVAQVYW